MASTSRARGGESAAATATSPPVSLARPDSGRPGGDLTAPVEHWRKADAEVMIVSIQAMRVFSTEQALLLKPLKRADEEEVLVI